MISPIDPLQTGETFSIVSGNAVLAVTIYRRIGSETVILLHGGPGVPDEMTEVRESLARYLQVITFDQRGIGIADNSGYTFTINDYINDIRNISNYFKLGKFHLLGHSWGGLYAQLYSAAYPEQILSLFLCSPASGTGKIWNLTEKEIFRYNYRRSALAEWLIMGFNVVLGKLGSSSAYRQLFRQIIINYHKGYNVQPPDREKLEKISSVAGTKTREAIKKHPALENFGKTPYPVIITYGQYDAYGKSREYVMKRFPYALISIIPASGHTPWKHNPKEFEKVLGLFYHPDGVGVPRRGV